MQHHFYDYKKIHMNDYIFNNIIMFIIRYGKIDIKVIKKNKPCIIMFFKIICIFNYLTNLILMNKIKTKKTY